jgi:hypothetical protein
MEQRDEFYERLILEGKIQRIVADDFHVSQLLSTARKHNRLAQMGIATDVIGAYQLAYDGLRKAVTAVGARNGYRVTARGGHLTVFALGERLLIGEIPRDWFTTIDAIRRRRNTLEYPQEQHGELAQADVLDVIELADRVISAVERLLKS